MGNEYKTINFKLNGQQSLSIPISIKKNGKYISDILKVVVKGSLKFSSETNDTNGDTEGRTYVYPVLFSTDEFEINDGKCVITLLYRSEDLFEGTKNIVESIEKYTDEDISLYGVQSNEELEGNKNPLSIKITTGEERRPYWISLQITAYSEDGSVYMQTIDRGITPQGNSTTDVDSLFFKSFNRTSSNLSIDCYNNEDWVPVVDFILSENNSSSPEIISEIEKLGNSTSFGMSTSYDAIVKTAQLLSDTELDGVKKLIYLFTDNEATTSTASVDDAIEEINNIDGNNKTPIISGNVNMSNLRTLSVRANSSDTVDLNKLSYHTGGQSVTINTADYTNDIIKVFYHEAVGALGYGTYEFTINLEEEVLVNYISSTFEIDSENSNATWEIETSKDGYNFTAVQNVYNYNEDETFSDLYAQYIKFKITFITGFSTDIDEYGTYPSSPALTGITIIYNKAKVKYLYLSPQTVDEASPFHVTMTADANEINTDEIKIGIAQSDSSNWEDYSSESQPFVSQSGKTVVPLRFSEDVNEFQQEPLRKIDPFTLKTEYGRFDPFDNIIIYNKDDDVVSSNKYSIYSREGLIHLAFALPSDYVDGDYKIGIIHSDQYKVGLKLTNKTNSQNIEIYGIGYMYSTSKDLLPPLSKAAPEAREVKFVNEFPNKFSKIEASYIYYDSNFDKEDTTKRKINWYINGAKVNYLENLISWNDITDPQDPLYEKSGLSYPTDSELGGEEVGEWIKKQGASLLDAGDNVYFEIQVTDGELYSNIVRSSSVSIIASVPVGDQISIKSKDINGNIVDRITSENTAVLYPSLNEALYADEDLGLTEIVWYVNDEIFKKGTYGDADTTTGYSIKTIKQNEVGTENYIDYGLRMNNKIFCQITPRTPTSVGETITTDTVTVVNSIPQILNLDFLSSHYKAGTNVILAWNFFDFEVILQKDIDITNQSDQTMIKWYRKKSGSNTQFELVYSYNDPNQSAKEVFHVIDYTNQIVTSYKMETCTSTISGGILVTGQQWYAEVTPNDGVDSGTMKTTKIITIAAAS